MTPMVDAVQAITTRANNTAPTATGSSYSTTQSTAVSGTLSATTSSGTLTYRIISNGTLGTAVITNPSLGAFTYTPKSGVLGQDSFTFKANNGTLDSNEARSDHRGECQRV